MQSGISMGNSAEDFHNTRHPVLQDGMAFSSRSVGIPSNPSIHSSVSTTSSVEGGKDRIALDSFN